MRGVAKGIVFIVLLTATAFSIWLCMVPVGLALIAVNSMRIVKLRRRYIGALGGLFFNVFAALLTTHHGHSKIYLYSDRKDLLPQLSQNAGLMISNHPSRIDWMFSGFCVGSILGLVSRIHVVLKDALSSTPVYGWAMQMLQFIFLARDRSRDVAYLSQSISYLLETRDKPVVFIFPEGTDLSDSNKDKCHQFAKDNNLPRLEHVLYPRSTGLAVAVQAMRGRGLLLHDFTIAYENDVQGKRTRPSETGLFRGQFPQAVHIFIDTYEIDSLPESKTDFDEWLRNTFYRKELILQEFYEQLQTTGRFEWVPEARRLIYPSESTKKSETDSKDDSSTVIDQSLTTTSSPAPAIPITISSSIPCRWEYPAPDYNGAVLKASLLALVITVLLVRVVWFRWLCTCCIIAAAAIGRADTLELSLHGYKAKRTD